MAAELLADLTHDRGWAFGHPPWKMSLDERIGAEQRWTVKTSEVFMAALEEKLRYVTVVLAYNAPGPGRAVFACDYIDCDGDSFALGEAVWEWDAARQARCLRVTKA